MSRLRYAFICVIHACIFDYSSGRASHNFNNPLYPNIRDYEGRASNSNPLTRNPGTHKALPARGMSRFLDLLWGRVWTMARPRCPVRLPQLRREVGARSEMADADRVNGRECRITFSEYRGFWFSLSCFFSFFFSLGFGWGLVGWAVERGGKEKERARQTKWEEIIREEQSDKHTSFYIQIDKYIKYVNIYNITHRYTSGKWLEKIINIRLLPSSSRSHEIARSGCRFSSILWNPKFLHG